MAIIIFMSAVENYDQTTITICNLIKREKISN